MPGTGGRLVYVEPVSSRDWGMRMRKVVGEMRGRQAVRDLLGARRRRARCLERPGSLELQIEGVIYLTPDGDGYILYAAS